MSLLGKALSRMFTATPLTPAEKHNREVYRLWNIERAKAIGRNDLDEIDAIFARHLE